MGSQLVSDDERDWRGWRDRRWSRSSRPSRMSRQPAIGEGGLSPDRRNAGLISCATPVGRPVPRPPQCVAKRGACRVQRFRPGPLSQRHASALTRPRMPLPAFPERTSAPLPRFSPMALSLVVRYWENGHLARSQYQALENVKLLPMLPISNSNSNANWPLATLALATFPHWQHSHR